MADIQAWFAGLNVWQWGGIALVLFGVYLGRNDIMAMFGKLWPGGTTTKDDDHGDRAAQLTRLAECFDWFHHENCPEGMALIQQATPHAMHVHTPAASAELATVTVSVPAPLSPPVA